MYNYYTVKGRKEIIKEENNWCKTEEVDKEIKRLRKALEFYAQGLTEEDEGIECGEYGSIAREALKEG